mmetsp:Transcript_57668/g.172061  ORF Transcript_57668/g.172061 Transcript_57668/m.172061 type:complete len:259 (+) Transcript_57668:2136-2912(+)
MTRYCPVAGRGHLTNGALESVLPVALLAIVSPRPGQPQTRGQQDAGGKLAMSGRSRLLQKCPSSSYFAPSLWHQHQPLEGSSRRSSWTFGPVRHRSIQASAGGMRCSKHLLLFPQAISGARGGGRSLTRHGACCCHRCCFFFPEPVRNWPSNAPIRRRDQQSWQFQQPTMPSSLADRASASDQYQPRSPRYNCYHQYAEQRYLLPVLKQQKQELLEPQQCSLCGANPARRHGPRRLLVRDHSNRCGSRPPQSATNPPF